MIGNSKIPDSIPLRTCILPFILLELEYMSPGAVFMKGLSQVLGLSWLYFYTKVKLKTWLRPFMNTAPGISLQ